MQIQTADVEVAFAFSSLDKTEAYDPNSSLKSDLYKPQFAGFVDLDLAADKKIFLRSLIDHSVVESFGAGGKTNILSRVYPELAVMNQAYLFVFNNGTEPIVVENLKAWSMISADIK
ncbi:hypothetical protein JHK86_000836 [Glycine max]|nr:hypothetical protein JHK86_000836 [Glycine max]